MAFKITEETLTELQDWLTNNGFEISMEESTDKSIYSMQYVDFALSEIYLPTILIDEINSTFWNFVPFLRTKGLTADWDAMTLVFLHELGHCMTYCNLETADRQKSEEKIDELNEDFENNIIDFKKYSVAYWNILTEDVANIWAVNFANNEFEKVEKLEEIFEKCLTND